MRVGRVLGRAAVLACSGLALSGGVASAAQTIGSDLSGNPTGRYLTGTVNTFVQLTAPTGSAVPLTSAAPGVVVSLKFKHGQTFGNPPTVKLAVLRRVPSMSFPTTAGRPASPALPLSTTAMGATNTIEHVPLDAAGRPRGVAIGAGEQVGIVLDPAANAAIGASGAGGTIARSQSDGTAQQAVYLDTSDGEILVQARVEADADGDGYGDESQDQCPTSAATQGPCPVPSAPVVTAVPGAAGPAQSPAAGVTNCAATVTVGKDGLVKLCDATNPPAASTSQTLTATLPAGYAEAAKRKARKKPKPGPAGTGQTTIPAGQTVPVTVRLTAKAAKALRKKGALKVQATIQARGVDGQTATVSPTLILKAAKKPKRRTKR